MHRVSLPCHRMKWPCDDPVCSFQCCQVVWCRSLLVYGFEGVGVSLSRQPASLVEHRDTSGVRDGFRNSVHSVTGVYESNCVGCGAVCLVCEECSVCVLPSLLPDTVLILRGLWLGNALGVEAAALPRALIERSGRRSHADYDDAELVRGVTLATAPPTLHQVRFHLVHWRIVPAGPTTDWGCVGESSQCGLREALLFCLVGSCIGSCVRNDLHELRAGASWRNCRPTLEPTLTAEVSARRVEIVDRQEDARVTNTRKLQMSSIGKLRLRMPELVTEQSRREWFEKKKLETQRKMLKEANKDLEVAGPEVFGLLEFSSPL